jgi:WD40 repeat protein
VPLSRLPAARAAALLAAAALSVASFAAPGEPPARTDLYGDPLPDRALTRMGTVRLWDFNGISAVGVTPDGKTLHVVGWGDGGLPGQDQDTIRAWEVATGRLVRSMFVPFGGEPLVLSRDAKTMVCSSGEGGIRVYDLATGRLEREISTGEEENFVGLALAPDGKTLAATGVSWPVRIWETGTGKLLRRFGPGSEWAAVAYSPDGARLASLADGTLALWETRTGRKLWQCPTGWEGRWPRWSALAFSPDGRALAVGGGQGTVLWMDAGTGKPLWRRDAHEGEILAVAVSPDGSVLATAAIGDVRLWETAGGKPAGQLPCRPGASALAFTPDGKTLVTGGFDHRVRLWDWAARKDRLGFPGHQAAVFRVAFAPGGEALASAGHDGALRLWDAGDGRPLRAFPGPEEPAETFAFSPDGLRFAVGQSETIRVYDLASGKEVAALRGHSDHISALAYSPDGASLASADGEGTVRLWQPSTGKELSRTAAGKGEGWVLRLCFSPDGRLRVVVGTETGARLVERRPGGEARRLLEFRGHVTAVAFSRDGATFAAAAGDGLRLWDTATGRETRVFKGDTDDVRSVAFSPDGRTLVTGGHDSTVRLWEAASGRQIHVFRGHQSYVFCVAFAPDCRRVASGGNDMTALVWDVTGIRDRSGWSVPPPAEAEFDELWRSLAGEDAGAAHRAAWRLVRGGDAAAAFLGTRLRPAGPATTGRLARWVRDLGDDDFDVREKASAGLLRAGEPALAALEDVLRGDPAPEVRARAEEAAERLRARLRPEQLREVRAVQALEQAGAPEARRLLRELAGGAPEARLTQEAKASLERLTRRP